MASNRSSVTRSQRFKAFAALVGVALEAYQERIVAEMFEPGREKLVLIPRGNGKSTLLAALALFELLSEPRSRIAVGAASREQAGVLFEFARNMAAYPDIAKRVDVTRREIRIKGGDAGWLKVVASDGPKQHGLDLSVAIIDELHAHRDDELYLAFRTGILKRPTARMWTITTAGIGEESALGALRARAMQLPSIEREGKSKSFTYAKGPNLSMLEWSLPEDADIDNMSVVKEVNPASWLTEETLAEQREAVHEIAFRRYHCNQWVAAQAPWITGDLWDTCKEDPRISRGAKVVVGVDAAIRHDSTGVAIVHRDADGIYNARFEVWEPKRRQEIRLEEVLQFIRALPEEYDVQAVAYDRMFMAHAAQRLDDEGFNMVEFPQDNARMVPATRTLHEAVTHRRLRHGGHDTARRHALAAEVFETERGVRIKKTASRDRIDCIVALAMAVDWASRDDNEDESVYAKRRLVVA